MPSKKLILEDHVNSIIAAQGPKGALKGRYQYSDLEKILDIIHSMDELLDLQPYHFKRVFYIWNKKDETKNYELARKATGELIEILKAQYNWSDERVIEKINSYHFLKRKVKYNAKISGMLQSIYEDSPAAAVIGYYHNHPDEEVREKFKDLRRYHFSNIRNIWRNKDGTRNYELAREAMKELIEIIMERYGWTEEEAIGKLTQKRFHKEKIRFGVTLAGMLRHVYEGSPVTARDDYLKHKKVA